MPAEYDLLHFWYCCCSRVGAHRVQIIYEGEFRQLEYDRYLWKVPQVTTLKVQSWATMVFNSLALRYERVFEPCTGLLYCRPMLMSKYFVCWTESFRISKCLKTAAVRVCEWRHVQVPYHHRADEGKCDRCDTHQSISWSLLSQKIVTDETTTAAGATVIWMEGVCGRGVLWGEHDSVYVMMMWC